MDGNVTAEDRAWFLAQVREFFPFTDDVEMHVIRLALPRLGAYRADAFRSAMTDYVTRWSGRTRKFIVGYFLEALGAADEKQRKRLQAIADVAARERRAYELDHEMRKTKAEMERHRTVCRQATEERRGEAIAYLRECGWKSTLPESIDDWSPLWCLAVSDLLTDATWPDVNAPAVLQREMKETSAGPKEAIWFEQSSVRINVREALRRAGSPPHFVR